MTDKKISELDAITGANTAATDVFVVVDTSTGQTKKITREELNNAIERDVLDSIDIDTINGDFTVNGNITVSGTVDGRDISTDGTKLDGIEALADVTDATNVAAAGAAMLTGATFTGNVSFGDSNKAIFGAGSDLQIYHDGSNSRIQDAGTGNLIIRASGGTYIQGVNGENGVVVLEDGAVSLWNNGSQKLATTSTGIDVTGTVTADGLTVSSGSNQITLDTGDQTTDGRLDVGHFANGTFIGTYAGTNAAANVMRFGTSGSERMRIDSSGNVLVGKTSTSSATTTVGFHVQPIGVAVLTRDGAAPLRVSRKTSDGEVISIHKDGTTVGVIGTQNWGIGTSSPAAPLEVKASADYDPAILVSSTTSAGNWARLDIKNHNVASSGIIYQDQTGTFSIRNDGAHPITFHTNGAPERMRIDSSGNVGIGTTSPAAKLDVTGEIIATSYNETYDALSGTTPTVDCHNGNMFSLTTSGNTTFTFSNPPASGTAFGFTLKLVAGGTHTITYPASVDWAGGTAPDAPASGETDVLVFITHDGGTTWYGFRAGDAMA